MTLKFLPKETVGYQFNPLKQVDEVKLGGKVCTRMSVTASRSSTSTTSR